MATARPRVAIVGAGPAGAFAAASLLRAHPQVEIDLFDRLPTPWGLLRGGVAPDHQEIKRLSDTFDRQTLTINSLATNAATPVTFLIGIGSRQSRRQER